MSFLKLLQNLISNVDEKELENSYQYYDYQEIIDMLTNNQKIKN